MTTIKEKGATVPVRIDDSGVFRASVDGFEITSTTLHDLKEQVRKAVSGKKVEIPFSRVDERGIDHWVATGVRAGSSMVLARHEATGKKDQISGAWGLFERLTPEQEAEGLKLIAAFKVARERFNDWTDSLARIELRQRVEEALSEEPVPSGV